MLRATRPQTTELISWSPDSGVTVYRAECRQQKTIGDKLSTNKLAMMVLTMITEMNDEKGYWTAFKILAKFSAFLPKFWHFGSRTPLFAAKADGCSLQ